MPRAKPKNPPARTMRAMHPAYLAAATKYDADPQWCRDQVYGAFQRTRVAFGGDPERAFTPAFVGGEFLPGMPFLPTTALVRRILDDLVEAGRLEWDDGDDPGGPRYRLAVRAAEARP